ncbi:MAG: hypothetical protein LBN27_02135 [Prevotellaceae bacterium]|jgi:hypothetical protein|nr:hypothetical protein [Prevotellaceae bacterium]
MTTITVTGNEVKFVGAGLNRAVNRNTISYSINGDNIYFREFGGQICYPRISEGITLNGDTITAENADSLLSVFFLDNALSDLQQKVTDNYNELLNAISLLDKDHYIGEYDFGKYLDQQSEDDQALITAQAKILIWGEEDAPNHADTEIFSKSYLVNTYNGTRREWILDNDQTTDPPSFWWSVRTESSFPVATDDETYNSLPNGTIYVEAR